MIDETLSDSNSTLAILGVANKEPLSAKELIRTTRFLAPQAWQPTSDVLRITINRLLAMGYLRRAQNNLMATEEPLEITNLGRKRLDDLLSSGPETISCNAIFITLALQACFSEDQLTTPLARGLKNQQRRDNDYLLY